LLFITAVSSLPLSHSLMSVRFAVYHCFYLCPSHSLLSVRFAVYHCCPFHPSLSQSHNKSQHTDPINYTTYSYTKCNISVHFAHSLLDIVYHFIDILRSY
jgi:hypothetical protein